MKRKNTGKPPASAKKPTTSATTPAPRLLVSEKDVAASIREYDAIYRGLADR